MVRRHLRPGKAALGRCRPGRRVGRYVIMPDHVHFFAAPGEKAKPLGPFVGRWKEWTAKTLDAADRPLLRRHRFFDHVLRSRSTYAEKWEYVRLNPVRAGLVDVPEDWPFAGHVHFDDPISSWPDVGPAGGRAIRTNFRAAGPATGRAYIKPSNRQRRLGGVHQRRTRQHGLRDGAEAEFRRAGLQGEKRQRSGFARRGPGRDLLQIRLDRG